ncbi:hypothetical protein Ancab_004257 [Ancistrocladus abbreviatus]
MSNRLAWLPDFINGSFTTSRAKNHSSTDFRHFCVDCRGHPFRDDDMSSHPGHRVMEIHLYSVNSNKIVFLKSRKGPRREGCSSSSEACRICGWKFPPASPDSVYCSLGCKYQNLAAEEKPPEEEERGAMLTVVEERAHLNPKERRRPRKGVPSRAPLF